MRIAVVILNWNGRHFLEQFLPGVIDSCHDVAEVVVADNDSADDSVEFLRSHFPQVRLIINSKNFGFAEGYNAALKQIDTEYYVLLNSDIEVPQNWLQPVIALMDSDENIAACQPKILSFDNRSVFEYAGAGGGFIDRYGYPFCRGRIFQSIETDEGQYDDIREVFWATGACMFIRASLYHQVGGLDKDFFAHMEEIDICWRLKQLGYKIMYCGQSEVYHIGGGSLDKSSPRKTYLNIRNNNIMLYKNLLASQLYQVFFMRFFLDLAAAFKFLFDGGFQHFLAVTRAHLGFYYKYKISRRKRRMINQRQVSMIYQGNIVLDHYLKGIKTFGELDAEKFSGGW
jgi:GT2 family glycosyltransferase